MIGAREQHLRSDPTLTLPQHDSNLRLLYFRKNVDDAIHCLDRAVCVQCSKDQTASLSGRDRQRNSLEVAHFADENDIGILSQRGAQSRTEGLCVARYFALAN